MCSNKSFQTSLRNLPRYCTVFLFVSSTVLFYLFPCIWLMRNLTVAVPILQTLLLVPSLISYFLCVQVNPGIISKDPESIAGMQGALPVTINGVKLISRWCFICKLYCPPRSRHCYTCGVCVQDLDHHCVFLNTCIGKQNYRFFYMLLFFLTSYFLSMLCFSSIFLIQNPNAANTAKVTTFILGIFSLITSILLSVFFAFHSFLIGSGINTYEKIMKVYKDQKNPFDQGCRRNFAVLLFSCLPLRNSRVNVVTMSPAASEKCPPISPNSADTPPSASVLSCPQSIASPPVYPVPTFPDSPPEAPLPTLSAPRNSVAPVQTPSPPITPEQLPASIPVTGLSSLFSVTTLADPSSETTQIISLHL